MKRARKYIKEFETYVNEIDKLKGAELLSYMRRSGFLVTLKRCRPEFFNEESQTMLDEYDILIREDFYNLGRSSSQAVAKYERFTYLNDREMPKLILSLRDSMKKELLDRHQKIHQIDEEQRKIRKRISPYFEVSAILMQLESDYDDMCEEYRRRYKSPVSEIESSSIQKNL